MQKSPPPGGERKSVQAERRESRRDGFHNNRFSLLMEMDSEKIRKDEEYEEEEIDSMKRGEYRDRSPLGQSQRDMTGRRRKREEETVEKREEREKMEVEEGEDVGTQKTRTNTEETNIEQNRKEMKKLNRGFVVQGGILKNMEEVDTSEMVWKKDKFDESQKGPVKVKVSLATEKVKVVKGRNFIAIMQALRVLKVQYEQINMINHRAAEVSFRNVHNANDFLNAVKQNKEVGIETSIDRREIAARGVVTDWPDSIAEFWEAVNEKEEMIKIEKMIIRKWNNIEKEFCQYDTGNLIITFKGNKIPKRLWLWEHVVAISVRP